MPSHLLGTVCAVLSGVCGLGTEGLGPAAARAQTRQGSRPSWLVASSGGSRQKFPFSKLRNYADVGKAECLLVTYAAVDHSCVCLGIFGSGDF